MSIIYNSLKGVSMHKQQAGFHILPVILAIVMVSVIGFIAWRFLDKQGEGGQNHSGEFAKQYPCKERDVAFTSPPLRMEDLGYIRPLGAMLDGHVTPTDHVYVGPIKRDVPDNTYPVLMPADGTIVEVGKMPAQYVGDRADVTLAPDDHRIVISFSCRYYAIYIHVHKLADKLAEATKGLQPSANKSVSIDLKAGETVGFIGGDTFDWTPIDTQTTLSGFVNPAHYATEPWKIHTVSPFDLYTGEIKKQLEAKSLRASLPIGGKIDYDIAGKLIGTWFKEGTNGYQGANQDRYWDGHLSVVPDYISPDYTVVSIGNWNGSAMQFVVKGTQFPENIGVETGVVKYELVKLRYIGGTSTDLSKPTRGMHPDPEGLVEGTISFQVLEGNKLRVKKFPGLTAKQVTDFTEGEEAIYER